ncbi:MAG: hypothetical protein RIS85_658, partial [Pseudomonadota bacterium]
MGTTDWNTESYGLAALEDRCAPRDGLNIPARMRDGLCFVFVNFVFDFLVVGFCGI